jgi:hypothetical protein
MGQNVHPAGASALGVDSKVGAPAAIIDRAIALGWSFTIGFASTLYLWYKSPQDFKKTQQDLPESPTPNY